MCENISLFAGMKNHPADFSKARELGSDSRVREPRLEPGPLCGIAALGDV